MTVKHRGPQPPDHLSRRAKAWFRTVVADYALEDHHLHLLRMAAEALDRAEEARALTEKEGLTILDRFDQQKPHPAVAIRRDAEVVFARLIRELDLDTEPPPNTPRPPNLPRFT